VKTFSIAVTWKWQSPHVSFGGVHPIDSRSISRLDSPVEANQPQKPYFARSNSALLRVERVV
jgi:hypothetical protein